LYNTREAAVEILKQIDIGQYTISYGPDKVTVRGPKKPVNLPKSILGIPIEFTQGNK